MLDHRLMCGSSFLEPNISPPLRHLRGLILVQHSRDRFRSCSSISRSVGGDHARELRFLADGVFYRRDTDILARITSDVSITFIGQLSVDEVK